MQDLKQVIIDAGMEMCKRNLTVGTWGNLSIRDPETGYIYLTPSGMNYQTCICNDIVVFDINGNLIEGERKPSIEKDLHIMIYQNRPDVNAVIHTHPLYSTVFCITQQSIPAITEEFAQIVGDIVYCADYALPGTRMLAENTVKNLSQQNAVLLTNHGTVCVGSNMEMAFKICDVVEKAAHLLIMCKNVGEPRIIPNEDIRIMQEFVKNSYGQK